MYKTFYEDLPVVPLRGLVVLPGELLNFDAGRAKSVKALEVAFNNDSLIFISAQKDARISEITTEDINTWGVVCRVRQLVRTPGDSMRVLVEGISRAEVVAYSFVEPYFSAALRCPNNIPLDPIKGEALRRRIRKLVKEYAQYSPKLNQDAIATIESMTDNGNYADAVANALIQKNEERQQLLEEADPAERMELLVLLLSKEIEVMRIDKRISLEVKKQVDKNQKEYYLREQIKAIRHELGEDEQKEADEFKLRMQKKKFPENVSERLKKEIARFSELPAGSHEAPMTRQYIECLLDLPWEEVSDDNVDIKNARKILDEDHFGLEKTKQRIIEHLAVANLTGKLNGQIICLVGPPGVGKTSISESIARALNRKFARMSLGGIKDESEIRGHRRTYIGAMPGRIIAAMRQAGTINPVLLFDEIDKLSNDYHGDPASAMLEVLDSAQNHAFRDHFLELPYDLSKVMFITTANGYDGIPRALRDRMEIIEVPSYLETEKLEIAKRHLLPQQLEKHGIKRSNLAISDTVMDCIISGYTSESGVRELSRMLAGICRKAACEIAEGRTRIKLTQQKLHEYLGQPKYRRDIVSKKSEIGLANGLAWTSVGGVTLEVETQVTDGQGQLQLTGMLGDVMQESAKAALTFVKAHLSDLNMPDDYLSSHNVHVHVPEGATPKDGPSAGITMATSMASAISGIPVKAGIAMTGEITLRGRVLPIGGLREKLLAATRAGLYTVIIPTQNRTDLEEISKEILDQVKIIFADDAMTVLEAALGFQHKKQSIERIHIASSERPSAVQ